MALRDTEKKGGAMNKLFALIAVVGLTFGLAACPKDKEETTPPPEPTTTPTDETGTTPPAEGNGDATPPAEGEGK